MRRILLLITALSFTSAYALPANTLTVCSYAHFKPISYDHGKGYEADYLRAIAKKWQMKIKFLPQETYEGLWLLPTKNKCDIATGGITPADYRSKQGALFTHTTMPFMQSLLVRKKDFQSGRITTFASFKNTHLKIGVVPGTTGESYAHLRAKENDIPETVFIQYKSESELLPALIAGKIDAIARGEIGNEYQAAINKDFVTIAKRDFKESFSFATKQGNTSLLKQLNQEIELLKQDKKWTYQEWLRKTNG